MWGKPMTPRRILATSILALSIGIGNAEELKLPRFKLDTVGINLNTVVPKQKTRRGYC